MTYTPYICSVYVYTPVLTYIQGHSTREASGGYHTVLVLHQALSSLTASTQVLGCASEASEHLCPVAMQDVDKVPWCARPCC